MYVTIIVVRIAYKQHLSIKKPMANELGQEIGGVTLAGKEKILGNNESLNGRFR